VSFWDYEPIQGPRFSNSKEESLAFGLSIGRATYSFWDDVDSELEAAIQEHDLVILRTRDLVPFDTLEGSTVISAGTLTYWASEIDPSFDAGGSDYHLVKNLNGRSLSDFNAVLQDSFYNYKNHYDLNPVLTGTSTTDAYLRWAMSRVDSDALTGLLTFKEAPVGVVSAVQQGSVVEIEIAGIVSSEQGRGHYRHLIGQLWDMVDQPNASQLVISTQIENLNVQAAWTKIGLKPQFEVHTTHIMRMK